MQELYLGIFLYFLKQSDVILFQSKLCNIKKIHFCSWEIELVYNVYIYLYTFSPIYIYYSILKV